MTNTTIILDCAFWAWRHDEIVDEGLRKELEPEQIPLRLPFTFNHLPFELADEGRDVVLIPIGVKS
jgi:hypothetical protein